MVGKPWGKKEVLGNLPPSDDPYWEYAEREQVEIVRDERVCEHRFVHRSSLEVECTKCRAGFFLTPGWNVREDGHIYHGDEFIL